MSELYSLFSHYNQDIAAVILNLLPETGKHIVNLKLSCFHFHQLINSVVPIHHFVYILRALKNQETHLPPLEISNSYKLHVKVVDKIWVSWAHLFLNEPTKKEEVSVLFTRFVLLYHFNPFCVQVVQWFPFHFLFLSELCQYKPYKDSSDNETNYHLGEAESVDC